jgi:hypothetical protein
MKTSVGKRVEISKQGRSTLIIEYPDEEAYISNVVTENVVSSACMEIDNESADESDEKCVTECSEVVNNLPVVVLDCANIGWSYGITDYSSHGVIECFRYLDNFSNIINIIGFIPSSYVRKKPQSSRGNAMMVTGEWEKLQSLIHDGRLVVVPAGDNDDTYIIAHASKTNGFIISNDFFNDHCATQELTSGNGEVMKEWLSRARVGYTFVQGTLMINPNRCRQCIIISFQALILFYLFHSVYLHCIIFNSYL